jgi:glutamine synthetase
MSSLEYFFVDHFGRTRGKTMCLSEKFSGNVDDLKLWTVDGSSTGQCETKNSDLILRPRFACRDPFRTPDDYLVLCDTLNPDMSPHPDNQFVSLDEVSKKYEDHKCWFGFEQEYVIMEADSKTPFNWTDSMKPQGPYYCSAGGDFSWGRPLAERHREMCLSAGLKYCGLNAEVMPSQWEFQIGPCSPMEYAYHLWTARYILFRLTEDVSLLGRPVTVSFEPKLYTDWNGSGGHTNFSTQEIRTEGGKGIEAIYQAIERLGSQHMYHMSVSGEGNVKRMSGRHETASYNKFSYGVGDRGASVRIPAHVKTAGGGYLEDRRYAANTDPCVVARAIMETICSSPEDFKIIESVRADLTVSSETKDIKHVYVSSASMMGV